MFNWHGVVISISTNKHELRRQHWFKVRSYLQRCFKDKKKALRPTGVLQGCSSVTGRVKMISREQELIIKG